MNTKTIKSKLDKISIEENPLLIKFKKYINEFIKHGIQPYVLKLRRKNYDISGYTIGVVKYLVSNISKLSFQDIETLKNIPNFTPYIDKIQELASKQVEKEKIKNVSTDLQKYKELENQIKENIEPFLIEQEKRIEQELYHKQDFIKTQKQKLTGKEFQETYGEKIKTVYGNDYYYDMYKFQGSLLGKLLQANPDETNKIIKKQQKNYRDKEYFKIDMLLYRLESKYPGLENLKMTHFQSGVNGIEFILTANIDNTFYTITTNTIYAGGYNIQRLHLRWLMHIKDSKGNEETIESK